MNIGSIAKAVWGGATAFVGSLATALGDGHVTPVEWCVVPGATLAAHGVVWAVPNRPALVAQPDPFVKSLDDPKPDA